MDKDFQYSTDFVADFIVGMWEDSFLAVNGTTTSIVVPHGLSFTPLVKGNFSSSSDFFPSNEMSTSVILYSFSVPGMQVSIYADGVNISINAYNFTGSNKTLYWRVYALMPDDIDADVGDITTPRSDMLFDTDNLYLKVLDRGHVPISTTSVVIPHNLGYVPYVEAWVTFSIGTVGPIPLAFLPIYPNSGAAVTADESTVTFHAGSIFGITRYDYRIYIDG